MPKRLSILAGPGLAPRDKPWIWPGVESREAVAMDMDKDCVQWSADSFLEAVIFAALDQQEDGT
ncbi:MAG: hypothetical protein OXF25_01960 [Cyanobacteria bacterium MAG CAR3_bin_5]|nr:hypothetical protein [Cyanobacteria bacterium MAG CAR3_bin_5]